uniref:uncharacterized protein LOC122589699 n=1 Tax=Erigeron canadensis TaxID=72917 RepID=UPI001CB8DF13|nr:uncharacterized protein LOC122589699 [Erigeron canadensis]
MVLLYIERVGKACHVVPAVSDSAHSVHDAHSHIPDRAAQIDPDVAAQNDSELRGIFDDMDDPVNRASSVSPVKRTGGADLKYTRTKRRRVAEATSVAIPDPPRPTAAVIPAVSQAQVLRPLVAPSLSYRLPSDSSLVRRVDLLETQLNRDYFLLSVIRLDLLGSAEPEVEAEEEVELTYEFELLLRYSDSDDSENSENASANDSDDDSSDDSDSSDDGNDEGVADSSDGSAATTETDTDESANERRTKLVHDVSAASESDHSHQSFVQDGAALHRERRSKACHVVPAVSDSAHSVHDVHSHIPDRAAQIDPDVATQNDSELRGIFDDMDDPMNRASSVSPVKRTGGADLKYTRTKRRRVAEATSVAIPDPPRPTAAVIPAVSQAQVLRPLVAPSLSYRLPSDSSLVRRVDLLETQLIKEYHNGITAENRNELYSISRN